MMIPYGDFGRLRLATFLPDADLAQLEGWEFEDRLWLGEALCFSEWLRLEDDPDVLRSLAIDFSEFPARAAGSVLQAIRLPVRAGISLPGWSRRLPSHRSHPSARRTPRSRLPLAFKGRTTSK